jgi:hypothetical protein
MEDWQILIVHGLAGTPGGIRTPDLLLRRQPLYPSELQAHDVRSVLWASWVVKAAATNRLSRLNRRQRPGWGDPHCGRRRKPDRSRQYCSHRFTDWRAPGVGSVIRSTNSLSNLALFTRN